MNGVGAAMISVSMVKVGTELDHPLGSVCALSDAFSDVSTLLNARDLRHQVSVTVSYRKRQIHQRLTLAALLSQPVMTA